MKNSRFAAPLLLAVISLALFPTQLLSQQTLADSVRLSDPLRQAHLPPPVNSYPFRYWDKEYLITYTADDTSRDKPAVVLYDRDGRVAREAIVWFKDAASTAVSDAAVTKSGKLIVSGGTASPTGVIANFIAEIDDTGHLGRVVRTTPFLPVYICAAEDGTVWSYGFERDEKGEGVEGSLVLRQYNFDKGQLQAMLDRFSLHSPWSLTRGRYPGEMSLRCTSHMVGLYNGAAGEFVEYDISTNTLKVSKVEPLPPPKELRITGFALTESGEVFASMHDRSKNPPLSGLFRLKFNGSGLGSWVPVQGSIGPYLHGAPLGQLLGTDGTELIYTRDLDATAYWSRITK